MLTPLSAVTKILPVVEDLVNHWHSKSRLTLQVRPIARRSSDKVEVVLLDALIRDAAEEQSAEDVAAVVQEKDGSEAAMIIYTSGTTGPPKGVVLTADNVRGSTK